MWGFSHHAPNASVQDLSVWITPWVYDVEVLGLSIPWTREHADWFCPTCNTKQSIYDGALLLNRNYTLRQNSQLLWHWARLVEPSSDELAEAGHVDHGALVEGWLAEARRVVAEQQEWIDAHTSLGGPGVDCELDEISFRAKAVRRSVDGDEVPCVQWVRYLMAADAAQA